MQSETFTRGQVADYKCVKEILRFISELFMRYPGMIKYDILQERNASAVPPATLVRQ